MYILLPVIHPASSVMRRATRPFCLGQNAHFARSGNAKRMTAWTMRIIITLMDNPSMDKLDRPAYHPRIKTSQCCQAEVRVRGDEEGPCYHVCTNCGDPRGVWKNRK
jgi:hypothetical protein